MLDSLEMSRYNDPRHFQMLGEGRVSLTGACVYYNLDQVGKTVSAVDYDGGPKVHVGDEVQLTCGVYRVDSIESVERQDGNVVSTLLVTRTSGH